MTNENILIICKNALSPYEGGKEAFQRIKDALNRIAELEKAIKTQAESEDDKMSYCDDCILLDICGKEGCYDEALAFCAHKNKFIHASILDKIRDEIAEYKDDKVIHDERNEMIDIVLDIIDKYRGEGV